MSLKNGETRSGYALAQTERLKERVAQARIKARKKKKAGAKGKTVVSNTRAAKVRNA